MQQNNKYKDAVFYNTIDPTKFFFGKHQGTPYSGFIEGVGWYDRNIFKKLAGRNTIKHKE